MIETLHRIGSRIRHSRFLDDQKWLWGTVEPYWQRIFERLSQRRGFATHINEDMFKLVYDFASRYDRYDHRAYEPTFYHAFIQPIEPGMTVFDIGAHIGLFTLAAAKRVGREGQVFAFEPCQETVALLKRHIHLNGWQDRVEVITAVVSEVNGVVPFYTHGVSMAASLGRENVEVLNPERLDNPAHKSETASVTLDQFCKGRNIRPNVLKIDVEGAELRVLRGAQNVLLNEQLFILCEIHPKQMQYCGSSQHELIAFIDSIGYCLRPIDEPNEFGIFHGLIARRE
jgi:FkbM family methyltransferase